VRVQPAPRDGNVPGHLHEARDCPHAHGMLVRSAVAGEEEPFLDMPRIPPIRIRGAASRRVSPIPDGRKAGGEDPLDEDGCHDRFFRHADAGEPGDQARLDNASPRGHGNGATDHRARSDDDQERGGACFLPHCVGLIAHGSPHAISVRTTSPAQRAQPSTTEQPRAKCAPKSRSHLLITGAEPKRLLCRTEERNSVTRLHSELRVDR
jgi:hypothetical protein